MNARRIATRFAIVLLAAGAIVATSDNPARSAAADPPDAADATPTMQATPPRHTASPKPEAIQVLRAVFGGSTQQTQCDATDSVRVACSHQSTCSVPVTLNICAVVTGIAPLIPALSVVYRCSDVQRQQTMTQTVPFTLRLTCRPKRAP